MWPRAVSGVGLQPGFAAFVEAKTRPNSAVLMRTLECDIVYHSEEHGSVRLPVENGGPEAVVVQPGDRLGSYSVLEEEELRGIMLSEGSLRAEPVGSRALVYDNVVGGRREIAEGEVELGPSLSTA